MINPSLSSSSNDSNSSRRVIGDALIGGVVLVTAMCAYRIFQKIRGAIPTSPKPAPVVANELPTSRQPLGPLRQESSLDRLVCGMDIRELQSLMTTSCKVLTSENIPSDQVVGYHTSSKVEFAEAIEKLQVGSVQYGNAKLNYPLVTKDDQTELDPLIFYWAKSTGVQNEISKAAAQSGKYLHMFQTASQYNGTESPNVSTPAPGRGFETMRTDLTQGPQAQITNPPLCESVNTYLGNRGFNMLAGVLTAENQLCLKHGYLLLRTAEDLESVRKDFKQNASKLETAFIQSNIPQKGSVILALAAAPAIGYTNLSQFNADSENSKRVQYFAALANFNAQFKKVLELAKDPANQDKTIVYHPCAVGLGVFENDPKTVSAAFKRAAQSFQGEIKKQKLDSRIQVQFEVFRGEDGGAAYKLVKAAGLKNGRRLGE